MTAGLMTAGLKTGALKTWRRPRHLALRFGAQQDGGATVLGLISICLMLLFAGVAVDVANLYRHQTLLQLAADSAAQGGLVRLARGGAAVDSAQSAARVSW